MDSSIARKALGDSGLVGVVLAFVGFLLLARENRRVAVGTLTTLLGSALVAHGLVESFLESMGMEYGDLY